MKLLIVFQVLGVVFIAAGLAMWSVPLSFVFVGSVIVGVTVLYEMQKPSADTGRE